MNRELISKFKNLPDELIQYIINYTNVITFRHGKYMDKINKNDNRYNLIMKIPKPMKVGTDKILLKLINYRLNIPIGYILEYKFNNSTHIELCSKFILRKRDGFDKYFETKTNDNYIIGTSGCYYKIVNYIM